MTTTTRTDDRSASNASDMGARRRRAHREPSTGTRGARGRRIRRRTSRARSSAHVDARDYKTKESQREFALLVGAFACVVALAVFVFVERVAHGLADG